MLTFGGGKSVTALQRYLQLIISQNKCAQKLAIDNLFNIYDKY